MDGWIKLHRKMLEWEWYNDNNTKIVFLHLLLTANHKEKNWQGTTIKRGQKLTSIQHLAEDTNLSTQQVRTALDKLKSTNEITTKSTNKNTLITIEKYSDYQDKEEENNKQDNKQDDNQITTNKNEKNNKNNISSSKDEELRKHFELIWKEYPNKKGKSKAEGYYFGWLKGRKINSITRKITDEQMYYAVRKYAKECEDNKIEQQYIKHGDTFFNSYILDYVE